MKSTNYGSPHSAVLSNLLIPFPFYLQIFSAPCSQDTFHVFPLILGPCFRQKPVTLVLCILIIMFLSANGKMTDGELNGSKHSLTLSLTPV